MVITVLRLFLNLILVKPPESAQLKSHINSMVYGMNNFKAKPIIMVFFYTIA